MINPSQWQDLITSSLPYLNTFKFKFDYPLRMQDLLLKKFKKFQGDFWQNQHQWYRLDILMNSWINPRHSVLSIV